MLQSQNQRIKDYLTSGKSITPLEALHLFGCLRLGARIADLKADGLHIKSEMFKDVDTGKRYAKYTLEATDAKI